MKDKKRITWVTADYFLDVDLPIVPNLGSEYLIYWYILSNKEINISKIKSKLKDNITLEIVYLKKHWLSPLSYFEYYSFFNKILKHCSDLYYMNFSSLSYTYLAVKYSFDVDRVIFTAHNVNTPKGARYAFLAKINMSYLLKNFKNFHVFSKNQKDLLLEKYPSKNVLYAPLALKDYGVQEMSTSKTHQTVVFLAFGHISPYKRIDLLIDAAQQVYEESKINFKVIIAGKCKNWNLYNKMIRYPFLFELKIGYIADEEIPKLFSHSDYMVLPYQDLAQSGAIMVAFNYGVPVIVSDIPQFKEFVQQDVNGYFFESESVDSLKTVILDSLTVNRENYGLLKMKTTNFIDENYSRKKICEMYANYFATFQ